jgi:hypothetical protein
MSPARTLFLAVLLTAPCALSSAQEAARSGNSADPVESARRDLEKLPSMHSTLPANSGMPELNVAIPNVGPAPSRSPAKRGGTSSASPGEVTGPSRGWLLDALDDRHRKNVSRFDSAGANGKGEKQGTLSETQSKLRPNPLNGYVEKWLTPQDRTLLMPVLDPARKDFARRPTENTTAQNRYDSKPMLNSTHRNSLQPVKTNPYLENGDSGFGAPAFSVPRTGAANSSTSAAALPPVAFPTTTTGGKGATTLGKPAAEEAYPAPTAPVVDERRYFPQLRKF